MVDLPHLLQTHDVGAQCRHSVAQVVDFQALGGPHATHTLVDVVGRHTQVVGMALGRRKQGRLKRFEHGCIPAAKCAAMAAPRSLR